ncbi:MAG TPA: isoprenylcysteine carboxylmethyltransferase family protein [Tepidisphaeraceae bacterium]|jgi:protein-S-isoprenylcysteine O-methyltransferase Ste14
MLEPRVVRWIIYGLWIIWCVVWTIKAFGNKRNAYSQSWFSRFAYILAIVAFSFVLKYGFSWRLRLYPYTIVTQIAGIVFCAAGVGVSIWARAILGSNWSGIVTLKENHELIRSGPYGFVRHPIYSGIILGVLGSIVALDPWVSGALIFVFVVVALKIKSLQEEKIMIANFPNDYPQYKRDVRSLIPFVL